MISSIGESLRGLMSARNRFVLAADRLIRATVDRDPSVDVSRELITMHAERYAIRANSVVIETAHETTGSLIDILA